MRAFLFTLFLWVSWMGVHAQSLAVVANNDTAICIGDTILLEAIVTGGTAPYTYKWGKAAWFECDTCASTLAFTPHDTTYTVAVTDSAGAIVIDYVRVTFRSPDTLSGEGLLNVGVFGNGQYLADSIVFSLDSSFTQNGNWNVYLDGFSDSRNLVDSNASFRFQNFYNFCAAVKKSWNCELKVSMCYTPDIGCSIYCFDTTVLIGRITGSITEKNTIQVQISPNPTQNSIQLTSSIFDQATINVFNPLGELVLQHQAMDLMDEQIDVSDLVPGIYILHIQTKDGLAVHRVVKN